MFKSSRRKTKRAAIIRVNTKQLQICQVLTPPQFLEAGLHIVASEPCGTWPRGPNCLEKQQLTPTAISSFLKQKPNLKRPSPNVTVSKASVCGHGSRALLGLEGPISALTRARFLRFQVSLKTVADLTLFSSVGGRGLDQARCAWEGCGLQHLPWRTSADVPPRLQDVSVQDQGLLPKEFRSFRSPWLWDTFETPSRT